MRFKDYLKKEETPSWIENHKKGDPFSIAKVLDSKVLYYGGADIDGVPISIINKTHAVHTYIYVDYGTKAGERIKVLSKEEAFRGYRLFDMRHLAEKELSPHGWTPHIRLEPEEIRDLKIFAEAAKEPFALLAIFEREEGYDDSHGAKRFALIYIGGDSIATYDALFINNHKAPYILFLRDHGFGGNYANPAFGKGGPVDGLVKRYGPYPEIIFTDQENRLWDGYSKIKELEPEARMYLYKREKKHDH